MFPFEKFDGATEITYLREGRRIKSTDAELLEELLGYVFEDIPALEDFDVVSWEAYADDCNVAEMFLRKELDNGYLLDLPISYADGETTYFWGTLYDSDEVVVERFEWGKYDDWCEWVQDKLEEAEQMRLF